MKMALACPTGLAAMGLLCGDKSWARRSADGPSEDMRTRRARLGLRRMATCSLLVDEDGEYLVDAPVSVGDGFSFTGGKYSDTPSPADEWFARGKILNAFPVQGGLEKAKDPLFGLAMGEASQTADEAFRWFYVEEGHRSKPSVLLTHGFPSQAYSFRKILPLLSNDRHVVTFDWLGFGFSDKPQPKYGFNYTVDEYAASLKILVEALDLQKFSLVAQGFFAPAVVQYAVGNPDNVEQLILINPPLTDRHSKLPPALSAFAGFLGEIFAQDPLKASDKPLSECGPYLLDEEDAMVYRRPYLSSGSAGFAVTALSRALQRQLKESVQEMRQGIGHGKWSKGVSIVWGKKDRWLDFKGVKEFSRTCNVRLIELPEVGHHAQEDYGEEVCAALKVLLG